MVVHDLKLGSLDYTSEVLTTTCISTVSPHCQTLSSYCVSLWMLQKELHTVHCTLFNNWLGIFQPRCLADEDCLPIIRENKMSQSTGTFPIAVAPAVMCEKLNWFWVPTINGARTSAETWETIKLLYYGSKLLFRLKFLNLGRFSISFVS